MHFTTECCSGRIHGGGGSQGLFWAVDREEGLNKWRHFIIEGIVNKDQDLEKYCLTDR